MASGICKIAARTQCWVLITPLLLTTPLRLTEIVNNPPPGAVYVVVLPLTVALPVHLLVQLLVTSIVRQPAPLQLLVALVLPLTTPPSSLLTLVVVTLLKV